MTQTVRHATVDDLGAIAAIVKESPSAPQWSAVELRSMLPSHADLARNDAALTRTVLVACVDVVVAGFAVYTLLRSVFPPEAELESLAVAVPQRRSGVGVALLHAVVAAVSVAGAEALLLEVRAGNVPALSLYREAGFHAVGIRALYYAAPAEDAVSMHLALGERRGTIGSCGDGLGQ